MSAVRARALSWSTVALVSANMRASAPASRCASQSATIASQASAAVSCSDTRPELVERSDAFFDVSVADLFGRVALARVGEAVVVGELGGADNVGDAGQQPADVDGRDLTVVTGGDELAPGGLGDPLERDEGPGVTHRSLIENDHAAGGQLVAGVLELGEQPVHGARVVDVRGVAQQVGGGRRGRDADDGADTRRLEGLAADGEGRGLAGAGAAAQDIDDVA